MGTGTPDYGEIQLDDTRFKLASDPTVNAVDRFPGKITIGDYGLDSNDLLSSWVVSDLTGGHGVADLQEGTDTNRYRWGNLNTRYPKQWAPPFARYGETVGGGYVYPLGDMTQSGVTTRYAVAGTHRLYSDIPTGTPLTTTHWTDRGAITGIPSDKAVVFTGLAAINMLYVPQGTNGYSVYDTSGPTLRNVTAAELMVSFCLWDNKLIGIDSDGQLYYATTATAAANTTFTSYGSGGKLDKAFSPKHLLVYYNRAGEEAVYVVTDQNVWVFDPATPRLYVVPDLGSPNPGFGAAACTWRGLLYISSGMDIFEFNGNVVRNIGLSRDDGPTDRNSLPYQYLNTVVDLIPSQNSLYAYVKGALVSGTTYYASMQEYSSFGWCTNWTSALSKSGPSWGAMTRAGGGYALWWGDLGYTASNANTGFQPLPTNNTNPREALASGSYSFGVGGTGIPTETYTLETGWFDANMPGYTKIASALQIGVDPSGSYGNGLAVYYRTNLGAAYTLLTTFLNFDPTTGLQTKTLGTVDANGVAAGFAFDRIEFKIGYGDDSTLTSAPMLVEKLVFNFLKVQNPSLSWTIQLDLSNTHDNKSPEQQWAKLTTLRTGSSYFALKHFGTTYRVRLSGVGGGQRAGKDFRSRVTISVLEIPQTGGAGTVSIA